MGVLPKEAEALLAVSPDEFVEERKRIARALRDDGRREDADAVAALRKPPPVVLAANRAARDRPQAAKAAAKAAERVAKSQLGSNADAYRAALAELDDSLDLLAEVALAQLSTGGKPPTEAVARRLRALLRNAVADEEARKELARGLLREEVESAGFGAFAGVTPPRPRRAAATDTRSKRDEEKRRERERALRDELDDADQVLAAARGAERDATRARERAEREVEALRARLERVTARRGLARERLRLRRCRDLDADRLRRSDSQGVARFESHAIPTCQPRCSVDLTERPVEPQAARERPPNDPHVAGFTPPSVLSFAL